MRTYTTRASATTYLALLFLGTFTPFVLTYGATVKLPQTGQTQCYDSTGTTVACAGTGHDGETKTGVAWPSPRFLDNGDGTITDKLTGLMWLKDANCARTIGHDPDGSGNGSMGWLNALAFVSGLNDGTYNISSCASYTNHYSNWHLPNSNELASIINYSVTDPSAWLNSFGFTNVMPNYYWSSTSGTYPYSGYRYDGSILVDMRSGGTGGHYPKTYSPYNPYFTWPTRIDERVVGSAPVWKTGQTTCYSAYGDVVACVGTGQDGDIRSGIEWPAPRFKDNADGTVTDNLTGLMWTKSDTVLGGTNRSWQDILNLVKDMNAGLRENFGYSDWRLPNIVEITSLLSRQYDKPVLPEGHPFDLVYGYGVTTWTSTSVAGLEQSAWMTDTSWGPRIPNDKSAGGGNGWPVRGGSLSPPPPLLGLTIQLTGSGNGKVTSAPVGIECPTKCSATFADANAVQLIAEASPGSVFIGWSYPGCSPKNNECAVLLNTDSPTVIEATFAPLLTADDPKIIFIGICGAGFWGNECIENEGWFDPRLSNLYNSYNPLNWEDLVIIGETDSGLIATGLRIGTQYPNSVVTIASFSNPSVLANTSLSAKIIVENQILPFYKSGDRIILIGHSYGAVVVGEVASQLNKIKIPVQTAGWIDAALKLTSIKVPGNVMRAYNYYYPRPIGDLCLTLGASRIVKNNKNSATEIVNTAIENPPPQGPNDGYCAGHRNMDNDKRVWIPILNYILNTAP